MTERQLYLVLLLRTAGGVLNDGFELWAERLPEVGDEIELAPPADFRAHGDESGKVVRAVVTGIEPDKHSPVRAREI